MPGLIKYIPSSIVPLLFYELEDDLTAPQESRHFYPIASNYVKYGPVPPLTITDEDSYTLLSRPLRGALEKSVHWETPMLFKPPYTFFGQ